MASFAEQQVERLETLLVSNVGVQSISVDGQSVQYADLLEQYDFWKAKAARDTGKRPRVFQVDLGGF